mmetsp:Transcript_49959/g.166943  ORF Transcript_49959/g.166943 Transcript_49959/m.166943 type:complete len:296 (+) Transcript_49959:497-1384(+)
MQPSLISTKWNVRARTLESSHERYCSQSYGRATSNVSPFFANRIGATALSVSSCFRSSCTSRTIRMASSILQPTTKRACGPRSGEQHVSLGSEHLGDVPLNLLALCASLVEPIQQEQRAARHHRLPQHAVQRRRLAVLEAQIGVDPIPRRRERAMRLDEPLLQPLHLDQDRDELTVEREGDHLRQQRRLAARRAGGQQRRRRPSRLSARKPLLVHRAQLGGEAAGVDNRGQLHPGARHLDGDALLQRIEPPTGERVGDVRVLRAQGGGVPRSKRLKNGHGDLERRVVPRVQCRPV